MRNKQIQDIVIKEIISQGFAGYKYGQVKKVIIEKEENSKLASSGKIVFFYKNAQPFETYQGQDRRMCEIFTFEIQLEDTKEELEEEIYVDLYDDYDYKGDEWGEKLSEKMSDRDFFEFWT